MTTGNRLKEERTRLGYSQEAFAKAGGVSRQSQIMYEQDNTEACSGYFTLISAIGADVMFILTGVRSSQDDSVVIQEENKKEEVIRMYENLNNLQKSEIYNNLVEIKRVNDLEETIINLSDSLIKLQKIVKDIKDGKK